jgi:hypothetical protein
MDALRAAWRSLRQTGRAAEPGVQVEWFGSGVIVSADNDSPYRLWQLLTAAAVPSDDFLIMPSGRALRHPSGYDVLRETTLRAAEESGRSRIWIAASGLGRPDYVHAGWLQEIAVSTGVQLLAPDGPIESTPDGTLYVAGATGAWGWRSYLEEGRCPVAGNRFPLPEWERVLPDQSIAVGGGMWLDPIPAGVALRAGAVPTTPEDAVFRVPVDPDGPTLAIRHFGAPPADPARLVEIFATLPPRMPVRVEIRHATGPLPDAGWLDALTAALGGGRAADPDGPRRSRQVIFRPASLLELGWQRTGRRLFRSHTEPRLLAEVIPAGILIRPEGMYTSEGLAIFDPRTRTLTVGAGGMTASAALVEPLSRMLESAPADPIGPVRLDLAGDAEDVLRDRLFAAALRGGLLVGGEAYVSAAPETVESAPEQVFAAVVPWAGYDVLESESEQEIISGYEEATPTFAPAGSPNWPVPMMTTTSGPAVSSASVPAAAPATAVQSAPVPATAPPMTATASASEGAPEVAHATAQAAPAGTPAPGAGMAYLQPGQRPETPVAGTAPPTRAAPLPPPPAPPVSTAPPVPPAPVTSAPPVPPAASPAFAAGDLAERSGPQIAVSSGPDLPSTPDAAPVPVGVAPEIAATPVRQSGGLDSEPEDQQHFQAGLGRHFNDSITTVNAALAAWPALRRDTSPGAKTDLVAVRTYLTHARYGSVHLNAALRSRQQPPFNGYVECLVSGLNRLPPCRRTMVAQGRLPVPASRLYTEGAILVEPGFRNAGGSLSHTVQGADVDYLIWSRSARQVGPLSEFPTFDEAVFLAGTRFKVLAVRGETGDVKKKKEIQVPSNAVLLRELLPGEEASASGLDDTDRSVLTRLERALARRRATSGVEPIDEPELIARLLGPPLGYLDAPGAQR